MVLPTSYASAFILLLLSLLCFSFWPNLYKALEALWRFELFSLDFAFGAILFSLVVAFTFGVLGREMSFTDRMLVAGRSAEVWIIGAGILFAFGTMMLLASITLLGIAGAFPLVFGLLGAIIAALHFSSLHPVLLSIGMLCMLLCIALALLANNARILAARKSLSASRQNAHIKGAILTVLSGLAFGGVEAVLRVTSDPEFGPGPYATLLMLSIGMVLSTPAFDFFFVNIKTVGDPIRINHYKFGSLRQHAVGFASGAIWALGALFVMLAMSYTGDHVINPALILIVPFISVLLCAWLGRRRWREFASAPQSAKTWLMASLASFTLGLVVIGLGLRD
jgi:glucose uptake protein